MLSLGKKIDSFKKKCFFIETGPYWAILSLMDREVRAGNARRSRGPIRGESEISVRDTVRANHDTVSFSVDQSELRSRPAYKRKKIKLITETMTCSSRFTAINWAKREIRRVFLILSAGGLVAGTPPCLKHLLERSRAENDDDFAGPVASSFHLFSQIRLWQIARS